MAQQTQTNLVQPVATPQHYVPATARELRAQAVHRLQIGLFGLAAMLLLVGLANIIMERARLADDGMPPEASVSEAPRKPSDPLAEIGALPAADPSATTTSADKR
jgi:hypothetical protein